MRYAVPTVTIAQDALLRDELSKILEKTSYRLTWSGEFPVDMTAINLPASTKSLWIIDSESLHLPGALVAMQRIDRLSHIVCLADTYSDATLTTALNAGVDACINKNVSSEILIKSLDLVMEGVALLPAELIASTILPRALMGLPTYQALPDRSDSGTIRPPLTGTSNLSASDLLSEREMRVLEWLADGSPNKMIARGLGIAEATVKVHIKAILRKARLRNRTQLALWATRNGVAANHEQIQVSEPVSD
jgi:two-component system, NarL family, nitrate/nitrite response regulator NarL